MADAGRRWPRRAGPEPACRRALNAADLQAWLVAQIAAQLRVSAQDVDVRAPFDSLGLSSKDAVALSGDLETLLGCALSPTLVYEYPSIAALSRHLGGDAPAPDARPAPARDDAHAIAIVGMACRFPGADSPAAFWRLLAEGRDMIREVPAERWDTRAIYHPDADVPGKAVSRWGSFLDGIDRFDPFFFGISPGEAERMDPQQRLLLELAWECFADAGCAAPRLAGTRTGVFVGISVNEYAFLQHSRRELINGHSGTGNALSIAANRISYFFDLHGPSMAVDTACSSSLMAVHQACHSLRAGECEFALAGGVNVVLSPAHAIAFTKAGVLARDGRCKVFDARADGYVRGEGGGLVALKLLARALADGDDIFAVIRGSAVHQDGRTNGLMAPRRESQEAVLRAACRDAGVEPGRVQYVEAHGTGTLLGDAMEAHALGAVVGGANRAGAPCAIGSVKSNVGHLEAAAGIAGLIKVALSLRQRALPPSIHYETPNPHIPFAELGLAVQRQLAPWPAHDGPALAGLSSFGFGGTNVHAVLEAAPEPRPADAPRGAAPSRAELVPLSAHTPRALAEVARSWREMLATADGSITLGDLTATAARLTHLDQRAAIVARSLPELADALDAVASGRAHATVAAGRAGGERRRVAFVFSGQGGQWPGMGRELLREEPAFRDALETCDRALRRHADFSVLEQLAADGSASRLGPIDVVQPVLFALQVALARLWQTWGVEPDATIGHSMGEVAAAHVAGALTLDDAALAICARSRLLRRLSGQGAMAVVALSEHDTALALAGRERQVAIAASNSPLSTVVAGDPAEVAAFRATMEQRGVWCGLVNVDVASHGPQTAPLAGELRAQLAGLAPRPARIPFVSTVTGAALDGVPDADYWARNLTQPVRFAAGVRELLRTGCRAFVEMSPHPVLAGAMQQCAGEADDALVLPSTRRDEPERPTLLLSLGALYAAGGEVDWRRRAPVPARCIVLPPYPWQRERYWIDGAAESTWAAGSARSGRPTHPLLGPALDVAGTPGLRVWQFPLDPDRATFLRDHRVNGVPVMPGSAGVELALAAAAEAGLEGTHAIHDLEFRQALVLGEQVPRTVQVVLAPAADGVWTFSLHSRAADGTGTGWMLHASATLCPAAAEDAPPPSRVVHDGLASDGAELIPSDVVYEALARRGLDYGPAFRGLEQAWRRNGEALARVALPDAQRHELDDYRIHPALLDASLQVLAAAALSGAPNDGATFMPTGCRRVRLYSRPGPVVWSHAVVHPAADSVPGTVEADVRVLDEAGATIAELTGLRLARVAARPPDASAPPDLWRYETRWRPVAWPPAAALPADAGDRWLLLADRTGVAAALRSALENHGQRCTLLRFDAAAAAAPAGGEADAVRRAIAAALGADPASPWRGVIHLWSADTGSGAPDSAASLDDAQARGCGTALHLVQELVARAGSLPLPRLWLVTRGALAAQAGDSVAPAQAPLWGLGRTVGFELPELRCTLVDLDPALDDDASAAGLFRQLGATDDEDLVALRGERRLVPRLIAAMASACATAPPRIRADGTYLVTGGLGGLGLAVAEWLAREGATHLVLLGRRAPGEAARAVVTALRDSGATVTVVAADVTSAHDVERVTSGLRGRCPPLRGIVHAAGVLDNASVVNLDAHRLAAVMAPKVRGAWNLHTATRPDPLDFFVLFSSAVSVLGSPGQGNYAAANTFLDALAHFRRREGLPATSINWGPWADIGVVAGGFSQPATGGQGVKGIAPACALAALGEVLREDATQIALLPFDMADLLELYPSAARLPFFSEVGGRDTHVARLYARPELPQPYVAPRTDSERRLAELWRQTLRIDRVGVRDSFFELGGDSVLAAQIVTAAHRSFGVGIDLKEAFQAFTIEHLAQRIEAALVAQVESLSESDALPEEGTRGASPDEQPIPPRPPGAAVPLSLVQERQLFLELLDPHTAVNNLCMGWTIDGDLDLARLEVSANRLLARHEALRMSFAAEDGRPVVRVAPRLTLELTVTDIALPGHERRAEALRLAATEARRPFALDRPPLLRVRLFRLAPRAHVMLVVVHHTIADGWSLGVFLDELFSLYHALGDDPAADLPPPPIQYGDFAAWQRAALRGGRLERDREYWLRRLGGELPVMDLPADHPRPARQTFAGATHHRLLPRALADRVKAVSRAHDATPFMTLVAAFTALLHHFTDLTDILIGTPTAGRTRPETETLIGAFINTLVLRTDLGGDPSPTFAELLGRVRAVALDAYAHQEFPFEQLVAELRPKRDLSRTAVFQVMFILQNSPLRPPLVPDLDLALQPVDRGAAQFDLTLTVTEIPAGLDAAFEYNTDLFEADTIGRLADAYDMLLTDALARPETPVAALPVMREDERRRLVTDLNATAAPYPRDTPVHRLVAEQAARTPDAVAVRCEDAQLTYAQLEARAAALAAELQRLGVGRTDRVAVLVERSADMVVAVLAVLQAGAAYLPLDPATPVERIAFVLRDAGARVLLCEGVPVPQGLDGGIAVRRVSDRRAGRPVAATVGPRDAAYAIYTSGSTGQPKGVLVPHQAVVNLLGAMQGRFALGPGQALLAVTSLSFDIAALEVFLPLISGATVVVAPRDVTSDSRRLADAIAAQDITIMQATPATWRMLIGGGWRGEPRLTALCGGEPLPPALAGQLLDRAAAVWNLYGPTETTIWSSACRLARGAPVTIGRPIENTQFYVLDERGAIVPTGVTGELHIGGDGVALGYIGRPDLTAERFVSDPFRDGGTGAGVMFRTGDRARVRRDGTVELLGRLDDQVKIHGFRVELGEIEAALSLHPDVREAAVVARDGAAGARILAAYYTPAADPAADAGALRAFLRERLPAYMVPAVFVPLTALPLTRAGKVDRRALPAPAAPPAGAAYTAPRTPHEAALAAAYAAVLAVERVGVHDNFFDLGGGSIQILEIIVRARADGMALTPEQFFQHQTVAELAAALAGAPDDGAARDD